MTIWNLVLAAGAGRRLASLTGGTPKQFWRPDGRTSLLEQTLARVAPIAAPERTVTVVGRQHRRYVETHAQQDQLGHVVFQPVDRGTAAGVLLGLARIDAADRDAIVVMTPSDHGVRCEDIFRGGLRRAVKRLQSAETGIVLFGVEPDQPYGDYGWITPNGRPLRRSLRPVDRFVEKPSLDEARRLLASGAVWNTMVLVAHTRTLLTLYERHLPHLRGAFNGMTTFEFTEEGMLDAVYAAIPSHDFSRDLLTRASNLSLMVWPRTMGWSDLGTPERLKAWHSAMSAA